MPGGVVQIDERAARVYDVWELSGGAVPRGLRGHERGELCGMSGEQLQGSERDGGVRGVRCLRGGVLRVDGMHGDGGHVVQRVLDLPRGARGGEGVLGDGEHAMRRMLGVRSGRVRSECMRGVARHGMLELRVVRGGGVPRRMRGAERRKLHAVPGRHVQDVDRF